MLRGILDKMYNYELIEKLLDRLLILLKNTINDTECNEVQEFIDVGEYGLALETLIAILIEESKVVSVEVLGLLKESAIAMSIEVDLEREINSLAKRID